MNWKSVSSVETITKFRKLCLQKAVHRVCDSKERKEEWIADCVTSLGSEYNFTKAICEELYFDAKVKLEEYQARKEESE